MVRRTSAVVLLCLVTLGAPVRGEDADPSEVVLSLETRRLDAMVKGDTAFLDQVLADDLTYTHSNGIVHSKEELVALLGAGRLDYRSIVPDNVAARVYGSCSVVTGSATISVAVTGKEDVTMTNHFTSVYVQFGDTWRLVAYQSTRADESSAR
jgi:hypothetical protein